LFGGLAKTVNFFLNIQIIDFRNKLLTGDHRYLKYSTEAYIYRYNKEHELFIAL
jgi:hypothetical protein